jgi:hypothetical protein
MQSAVRVPEREQGIVVKGEKRSPHGGKDAKLVVRPLDGTKNVPKRQYFLSIMK